MRSKEERQEHRARMAALDAEDMRAAGQPPLFTETCKDNDGKCINCNGRQLVPGAQNVFGAKAWMNERGRDWVECLTCGKQYLRG